MGNSLAQALLNVNLISADQIPANDTCPTTTKGTESTRITVDTPSKNRGGNGKKKRPVPHPSPAHRTAPAEPKPAKGDRKAAKKPASRKAGRPRQRRKTTPVIRTQLMGVAVLRDEGEIVMVRAHKGMYAIPAGLLPQAFLADYVDAGGSYVAVRIVGARGRKDRLKCRLRLLEQVFNTYSRLVVELEHVPDGGEPDSGFAVGNLPKGASPVLSQRVPGGRKTLHVFPLA